MKVSILPSWLHVTMQTAIATAKKLPAFDKKESMFKHKESVFYLFLVMVIYEFFYSVLVCCVLIAAAEYVISITALFQTRSLLTC